ncbi:MAG: LysM peptidoglycan-binding domain-containing protein, partial [Deltaproteobacteria bacterium]|nr:LysM peptidoglycan-binding domain-containing protein [Deltaproteobacteria bacterium]
VEKGDTLWDICEKYYGDPSLWPKLWEMNPFITNPHLLKPGDVITLLEEVPIKAPKKTERAEKRRPPLKPSLMGFDISAVINPETLGYLSLGEPSYQGKIFASENDRIMLSSGDRVYIVCKGDWKFRPGQELFIGRLSKMIKHPISGKPLGRIVSLRGRLRIEGRAGVDYREGRLDKSERTYSAKIIQSFSPIGLDDVVIDYQPVSPCIQPTPVSKEMVLAIVAAKEYMMVLGQYSVVYLDKGFRDGVRRGNIFEVVKPHVVKDTEASSKRWRERGAAIPRGSKLLLPDVPVGTVIIVESRPKTSTGLVLYASEIFSVGIYVKGGYEPTGKSKALSALPTCPIQ